MIYEKPFRYISEIANCKSISQAAENLNIRQPALSKYVKNIEAELQIELFDRSTTPISLTEAGKYYLMAAQKIIDADKQLHKQISDIQNKDVRIRIGIGSSRAPYLMPMIVREFNSTEPAAQITVVEGTTEELNSGLSKGELDMIISLLDEETEKFDHTVLFDEGILLAVPESYKDRSFEEAVKSLRRISSGKGRMLREILDKLKANEATIDCQNIITAFEMVRLGIGATLVPSFISDYGDANNIAYIPIPDEFSANCKRTVCAFYRKEQFISAAEKSFIECALRAVNSLRSE